MGFIGKYGFLLSAVFHLLEKKRWDAASIRAKGLAKVIFWKNWEDRNLRHRGFGSLPTKTIGEPI